MNRLRQYVRSIGNAIAKLLFRTNPARFPFVVRNGTKVLFLRHDALGDMISTLPMLRMVKKQFPFMELHVMCTKANVAVLDHCDFIDAIHIVDKSILHAPLLHIQEIRAIRSMDFDIIVNCLTSQASKNGVLTAMLSGKHSVTSSVFAGDQYAMYYSSQSKQAACMKSMWDKMALLGSETFGIVRQEHDSRAILPTSQLYVENALISLKELCVEEKNYIAINISVGQERNRWDSASYRRLIDYLLQTGKQPLLFGLSTDAELLNSIMHGFENIRHYPFNRHVLEIGEALKHASWGISPDTGFLHIGSAAQCPMIGLYCSLPEEAKEEWLPYNVPHRAVYSKTQLVKDISPEDVIKACDDLQSML